MDLKVITLDATNADMLTKLGAVLGVDLLGAVNAAVNGQQNNAAVVEEEVAVEEEPGLGEEVFFNESAQRYKYVITAPVDANVTLTEESDSNFSLNIQTEYDEFTRDFTFAEGEINRASAYMSNDGLTLRFYKNPNFKVFPREIPVQVG